MKFILAMLLMPLLSFAQKRYLTSDYAVLRGVGVYPFVLKRNVDAYITLSNDSISIINQVDTLTVRIIEVGREKREDTTLIKYTALDNSFHILTFRLLKLEDKVLSLTVDNGQSQIDFIIEKDSMKEEHGTP